MPFGIEFRKFLPELEDDAREILGAVPAGTSRALDTDGNAMVLDAGDAHVNAVSLIQALGNDARWEQGRIGAVWSLDLDEDGAADFIARLSTPAGGTDLIG